MIPRLYDLFLGNDQRWHCYCAAFGSEFMTVFPESWETRGEAQAALDELLKKTASSPTLH